MTSAGDTSSSLHLPALKSLGYLAEVAPVLVIDNREQTPLVFTRLRSVRGTLYSGDYGIRGLEDSFATCSLPPGPLPRLRPQRRRLNCDQSPLTWTPSRMIFRSDLMIAVGDVVIVHGLQIGRVVYKFLSATGEEIFDVELARGSRIAALENHIIANLGPNGWFPGARPTPCW
jgi:hypothetical protein